MDNQLSNTPHVSPFDAIRHINEQGKEYWSARELYKILGYTEWRNFNNTVIKRAKKACEENGQAALDHFVRSYKMVTLGSGSKRETEDVLLTRYAAYLVVMNGDPNMPVVAMGQQYFAMQTRRQEIADELELSALTEDQKRLVFRSMLATFNARLAEAAQQAGVLAPQDFATFYDSGYEGLYDGRGENDIHREKRLEPTQKISDHMGSEELGANIFRSTQTDAKIRRDQIDSKESANATHYQVGREVREAIARLGGTMPEDLPTPEKSIQQLQRDEQKRIEQKRQPSLFDSLESAETEE